MTNFIRRLTNACAAWFNSLLAPSVYADAAVKVGQRKPMGYQQIIAGTLATATKLTVPPATVAYIVGYAVIQCEGTSSTAVRWRDDGTNPDSTHGMQLFGGQEMDYSGDPTTITFIATAGSPILNISYYA